MAEEERDPGEDRTQALLGGAGGCLTGLLLFAFLGWPAMLASALAHRCLPESSNCPDHSWIFYLTLLAIPALTLLGAGIARRRR